MNRVLLFCWLAAITTAARAQMPGLRKYTQLDGFTATASYIIEQDDRGCLWIGTDNGGMSFDGKKFVSLLGNRDFPDADILDCRPLGNDRILLSPLTNNVCFWDKGRVITQNEDPKLSCLHGYNSNAPCFDPVTGTYWIDGGHTGFTYRIKGKEIKAYKPRQVSFKFMLVKDGQLIGNIGDTLYAYDTRSGRSYCFYTPAGQKISEGLIGNPYPHTEYVVTHNSRQNKIKIYSLRSGDSILYQVAQVPYPRIPKGMVSIDHNHHLWVKGLGREGFWFYGDVRTNPEGSNAFHFTEPIMLNTLFTDRNGNIWMSSKNNALYFISAHHFRNILFTDRFPLKNEIPKSIAGDAQGKMCIGYNNSLDFVCMDGNASRIIQLNSLFNEGPRNILSAGSNRFIIYGSDIALYDAGTHSLAYLKIFDLFKDVCLDGNEGIIAATIRGVIHYPGLLRKDFRRKQLFSGRASAVERLTNGIILIGTPNGLYLKQPQDDSAIKVNDRFLNDGNITDIQALPGGEALIGTNAYGLLHYRKSGIKPAFDNPRRHVRSIYKQNDSTYWAATNEGVYSFVFNGNGAVTPVKNYTFYEGLPSNNTSSIYVHRDTAYITTSEGLGILPLKDSSLQLMAPPDLYINKLATEDTVVYYPEQKISLQPSLRSMLVSLSAISYESLGNVHYYYRLYPLQTRWVHTADPDIRFAQLPPGDYVFEAYARNAKDIRSRKTIRIAIHIPPTFWQSIYFRAGIILLSALCLFLVIRRLVLQREKRKTDAANQKKRLAELELEAIKAQINPHFIHNCLNSIQYLNYQSEYEQAQHYLGIFARLIRMTLQYSRQTFLSLTEEMTYLSNYLQLEKLRFKDKLDYSLDIAPGVSNNIQIPAMLIQPYVENALKHGIAGKEGRGKVHISFRETSGKLQITITDNGPGFGDQEQSGAQGLRLASTRALSYNEIFNLNIHIERYNRQDHEPGLTGAAVRISIPVT